MKKSRVKKGKVQKDEFYQLYEVDDSEQNGSGQNSSGQKDQQNEHAAMIEIQQREGIQKDQQRQSQRFTRSSFIKDSSISESNDKFVAERISKSYQESQSNFYFEEEDEEEGEDEGEKEEISPISEIQISNQKGGEILSENSLLQQSPSSDDQGQVLRKGSRIAECQRNHKPNKFFFRKSKYNCKKNRIKKEPTSRKTRTVVSEEKLNLMTQLFRKLHNKIPYKGDLLSLKRIAQILDLGYSTILHKNKYSFDDWFRMYLRSGKVEKGVLLQNKHIVRKYSKSINIQRAIQQALLQRNFNTSQSLAIYLSNQKGMGNISRGIVGRQLIWIRNNSESIQKIRKLALSKNEEKGSMPEIQREKGEAKPTSLVFPSLLFKKIHKKSKEKEIWGTLSKQRPEQISPSLQTKQQGDSIHQRRVVEKANCSQSKQKCTRNVVGHQNDDNDPHNSDQENRNLDIDIAFEIVKSESPLEEDMQAKNNLLGEISRLREHVQQREKYSGKKLRQFGLLLSRLRSFKRQEMQYEDLPCPEIQMVFIDVISFWYDDGKISLLSSQPSLSSESLGKKSLNLHQSTMRDQTNSYMFNVLVTSTSDDIILTQVETTRKNEKSEIFLDDHPLAELKESFLIEKVDNQIIKEIEAKTEEICDSSENSQSRKSNVYFIYEHDSSQEVEKGQRRGHEQGENKSWVLKEKIHRYSEITGSNIFLMPPTPEKSKFLQNWFTGEVLSGFIHREALSLFSSIIQFKLELEKKIMDKKHKLKMYNQNFTEAIEEWASQ